MKMCCLRWAVKWVRGLVIRAAPDSMAAVVGFSGAAVGVGDGLGVASVHCRFRFFMNGLGMKSPGRLDDI